MGGHLTDYGYNSSNNCHYNNRTTWSRGWAKCSWIMSCHNPVHVHVDNRWSHRKTFRYFDGLTGSPGKLSREKTFTNFVMLQLKFWNLWHATPIDLCNQLTFCESFLCEILPIDPQKFSPSKVSCYTLYGISTKLGAALFIPVQPLL